MLSIASSSFPLPLFLWSEAVVFTSLLLSSSRVFFLVYSYEMDEPNARGWTEIKVSVCLVVLATVAVILRFVAKFRRRSPFEVEDWVALVGLVCLLSPFHHPRLIRSSRYLYLRYLWMG